MELGHRAVAQLGSALAWGARGRGFESRQPDHEERIHMKQPIVAIVLMVLSLFCFHTQAQAAQCYSKTAFLAEQFLRYKEQLMVTTMLCPKFSSYDLNDYMRAFVQRNRGFIETQENHMRSHFRREDAANIDKSLLTVKTKIANELSERVMQYSLEQFCNPMVKHLAEASQLNAIELKQRLDLIKANERLSTRPLCSSASASAN